MRINLKSKKAFTLVEIMIVVAIIALLAAMAIPAFNKVRQFSHTKACVNNLRQIAYAKDQYFLLNGGEVSVALADLVGQDSYLKSMPVCPQGDAGYTDPLTPETEAVCLRGDPNHALPIGE
ncbi:MAG TPA: prepilin-type N-terminal cleavage/methylation domain-containing protein [Opitutales bacterium]|nr:prepilin-type N-terminal cleavage/methylation domain-containing protein [Opitutales bacterium]